MNEQKMKKVMVISVDMITEGLTNIELAALNNVVQGDMNPHGRMFDYEKVEGLFTEADGTAHEETKITLATIVRRRLLSSVLD